MTCYADNEVPIKDRGDEEPSEVSNTSSITDDGNGHLEKGSSVEEINDTMASSSTMEASTSSNELNCVTSVQKHLVDKEVQVTYDTTFVNALLVRIDDLENSNGSLKSQLINLTFSINRFSSSDKDVAYYTGFPSFNMFQIF